MLADCLSSEDGGLRLNAALALLAAPGRSAFDALRPLLDDPNPRLRLIAARRLLTEDPLDSHTAAAVASAVADPNPSIRKATADLLAALNSLAVPTVLTALRERLQVEQDRGPLDSLAAAVEVVENQVPSPEVEAVAVATA